MSIGRAFIEDNLHYVTAFLFPNGRGPKAIDIFPKITPRKKYDREFQKMFFE